MNTHNHQPDELLQEKSTDAASLIVASVIVNSGRDERVLSWLISQVGEQAVLDACAQLAGNRKPYVSNLAKCLGLSPPDDLSLTPRPEAKERVALLRTMLGRDRNVVR